MGELDTTVTVGRTKATDDDDYPIHVLGNTGEIVKDIDDVLSDVVAHLNNVYNGELGRRNIEINTRLTLVREHKNKLY